MEIFKIAWQDFYMSHALAVVESTAYPHSYNILDCENNWRLCTVFQQIGRGSWRHWNEFIKPAIAEGKKFQDILIPTMDTVRYSYMMDLFIKHERYAVSCLQS